MILLFCEPIRWQEVKVVNIFLSYVTFVIIHKLLKKASAETAEMAANSAKKF